MVNGVYVGKSDPSFVEPACFGRGVILIRQECESSNYAKGVKEDATK